MKKAHFERVINHSSETRDNICLAKEARCKGLDFAWEAHGKVVRLVLPSHVA
jgi:hypothetical protein